MLFCSVHSPPITRLHDSIDARRFASTVAREHVRPAPAHPRRVTSLARLHRDEAAVLRWQGPRRGSRPREWGSASREPPARPRRVTPVACAHHKTRRARWQRSRRGSHPRLWVTSSRAPPPPDPAGGEVCRESHPPALAASRPLHACTAMKRPCFAGKGRAAAPTPRVGKCGARATLPPSPRHARACAHRADAPCARATVAPRLPPPRVR